MAWVMYQSQHSKWLQPTVGSGVGNGTRLLDNTLKHVYTCFMNDSPLNPKLAIVRQVPATCMGMHIRRASRILTQVYDSALRPTGLVVNQFTLLVAIHLFEPVAITCLAEELSADQTTVTRNVKLLEKQGYVAIVPGEDRRIKLASLTVEGQTVLAEAMPLWEQVQAELKQHFGAQKWQDLLSLLSEVTTLS